MAIFRVFNFKVAAADIFDFQNVRILVFGRVKRIKMHHHAKFCVGRSNLCWDMAIFWFRQFGTYNGCQMRVINSKVSERKFKFLCHVERTSGLLMCTSALPSRHPLWNASPKKEGVWLIFRRRRFGASNWLPLAMSLEQSRNKYQIEHLQPRVYQPWKIWWRSVW